MAGVPSYRSVMIWAVAVAFVAGLLLSMLATAESGGEQILAEVMAANLACELAEQADCLPFVALAAACQGRERTFSSGDGSLGDDVALCRDKSFFFHVSPLPQGFSRSVSLECLTPNVVLVETRVSWCLQSEGKGSIVLPRCVVRDSALPH